MTHAVWDPSAGDPMVYESTSFSAGQDCGTRVAACIARLSALELTDGSRWWNRWRRRLMARALVACAEDLELAADAGDALPSVRARQAWAPADRGPRLSRRRRRG